MEMKKNVGAADRYIRFILGLGFMMNIFSLQTGKLGTFILLALGLASFYSAYTGYSFVYDMLKIHTRGGEKSPEKPA